MIKVDEVRLWSVRFSRAVQLKYIPYPCMIAEEEEGAGYRMPLFSPKSIPLEVGGQITITLAGKGVLSANGEKQDCLPGTAFLYRDSDPSISYYCHPDSHEKWRFLWINFMGENSSRIIEEINRIYGYFFLIGQESLLVEKLLSYRKFAGASLAVSPLEGAQMFFELLGLLCKTKEENFYLPHQSRHVRDIQNEIQTAFAESLNTSTLAKKLGITREHLSKTFHEQTGQTLQEYREEQRLNEAFTLLRKSNLSCKEIAVQCHYGSYTSFFRSFKKHYNISPEFFRKRSQ